MVVWAALAVSTASQQQPAPPAPAAAHEAELSEALVAALSAPRHAEDALRREHGDAAVLEALLDILERCAGCPEDPLTRGQAFILVRELVADGASADAEQDARIGNVLRPALHDRVARRDAIGTVPALRADEQRQMIPALLPLLDDADLVVVTDVVRALGRCDANAEPALPRLEALLEQAPTTDDRWASIARRQAAEARIAITGVADLDAQLYSTLDAAGRAAVSPVAAKILLQMSVPPDCGAERLALADFVLDGLETGAPPGGEEAALQWMAFTRLLADDVHEQVRARVRGLATRLAAGDDPRLAELARHALEPPEVPFAIDEPPPEDARLVRRFRPASQLLTAAQTRRGLLAVSSCSRATTPAGFPPKVSTLHVWDVEGGTLLHRIDGVHGGMLVAAIDAAGQRLVIGTEGSVPQRPADGLLVCALDGSAPAVVAGHEAGVRQLALSADGRRAASLADDGSLRVTDLSAARVLGVQSYAKGAVPIAVALRADGERLVAAFADLSLRLESVAPFECLVTGSTRDPSRADPPPDPMLVGHPWMPKALCFLPDGERVLIGDASGRLLVWDPRTEEPPAVLAETGVGLAAITLSADGRRTLTSHVGTWVERRKRHPLDFDVTLWETEASAPLSRFTGMQSPPTTVAFVGETRVLGLTGSVLRVWRLDP